MSCSFSDSYRQPLFLLLHFQYFPKFSLNSKSTFTCQQAQSEWGGYEHRPRAVWMALMSQTNPQLHKATLWTGRTTVSRSQACLSLRRMCKAEKYTEVIFNSSCLKTSGYTGCHFKLCILWWNLASVRSSNSDSYPDAVIIFLFSSLWISLLPFFDEICTCCAALHRSKVGNNM